MNKRAQHLLSYIFDVILPQYGMAKRKARRNLPYQCWEPYRKISLHFVKQRSGREKLAYILVTIHNLFSQSKTPTMISTSTIALQEAITKEYIPRFHEYCWSIESLISRYLLWYERKISFHMWFQAKDLRKLYSKSESSGRSGTFGTIGELWREWTLFGSGWFSINTLCKRKNQCISVFRILSAFFLLQVRVSFSRRWLSESYDFQISNHNYILADIVNRREGKVTSLL